jgi:hypothetical protein
MAPSSRSTTPFSPPCPLDHGETARSSPRRPRTREPRPPWFRTRHSARRSCGADAVELGRAPEGDAELPSARDTGLLSLHDQAALELRQTGEDCDLESGAMRSMVFRRQTSRSVSKAQLSTAAKARS